MTSSNGNIFHVTGYLCREFTGHRWIPSTKLKPVTRIFDVFFDLRLNGRLSKQSWGWWFETPSRPLWRHSNAFVLFFGSGKCILWFKNDSNESLRSWIMHMVRGLSCFPWLAADLFYPYHSGIHDWRLSNCVKANITVTSWWARWRLKSPAPPLFTQPSIQALIKENIKAPHYWPLWGEFTGHRWIPRTNGQQRGNASHLMTSSWNLNIWMNKSHESIWHSWYNDNKTKLHNKTQSVFHRTIYEEYCVPGAVIKDRDK